MLVSKWDGEERGEQVAGQLVPEHDVRTRQARKEFRDLLNTFEQRGSDSTASYYEGVISSTSYLSKNTLGKIFLQTKGQTF